MSAPHLTPKSPLASGTLWGSAAALLVAGAALLGIDLDQAQVSETLTALGVVITAATMIWDRFRPRRPLQIAPPSASRGDGAPKPEHQLWVFKSPMHGSMGAEAESLEAAIAEVYGDDVAPEDKPAWVTSEDGVRVPVPGGLWEPPAPRGDGAPPDDHDD